MRNGRYHAIILAAGTSTRMKRFKPLLRFDCHTLTDRVISIFRGNHVDVTLVTGYKPDELATSIKTKDIEIVFNSNFQQGMFTSVQTGLKAISPSCQGIFIMPVDIPLVRPFTIRRLLEAAVEQPDMILHPIFWGRRGHPPLIPGNLVSVILNWHSDGTLKEVLDAYESIASEVSVPDENILFDVDVPEDYEALLSRLQRYEIPTDKECEIVLKDIAKVSPEVNLHSHKVAEVATALAGSLLAAGIKLDIEAIRVAAILHDIGKGRPDHANAGAHMLREMGFGKIGDIVAVHNELPEDSSSLSMESKIVFLADKYVRDGRLVSVDERFNGILFF